MRKIILFLIMGVVLTSYSQTYLLQEGFENTYAGWTRVSYSGNDWGVYTSATYARSGDGVAGYEYNSAEAADAYFFFQPLYLDAGTTYDISFWQRVIDSSYPEKFELTVGTTNAGSSQSTVQDWGAQTNEIYDERAATYTPTTSGVYYFAVHCYSNADEWTLFFDDVSVSTSNCKDHSCLAATNISSLPYSATSLTTCGNCNTYSSADACGSIFMDGPEYVFTYTPSSDGWVDIELTTDQSGLRNGASVFLLDGCPSSGSNCLASSTIQFPGNHGAPHIIYEMTAGQLYTIVVSNDPETTDFTNSCIYFDIDVKGIPQPNPTAEDCFGAQPICDSIWHENTPGNGQGNYPSEVNSTTSCLEGERNGNWYSFTVESSGTIKILIDPDYAGTNGDSNDNADDYDFSLYNVTNAGCEGIFDGSSPEVACNYRMVYDGETGNTGVNSDSSSASFESDVLVNAGETYMLYISQWSVSTNGFKITLGGTADYIDNDGPELTFVDQPNCAQNELTVHFSENIDCSTYDATDFILTNPVGSSLTVSGASSNICDVGGSFTNEVSLTLSGNITIGGTYTVGLVDGSISDQCGHNNANGSPTVSFTIVTPTITAGSNSAICQNQTLSLTETGGDANTWSWTGPNSFTSNTQNPNISNAQVAADGVYTVVGTITSTGCSNSDNVDVTVNPLPTVNATSNTPVCDGQTLTLGETGGASGASWVWSSTSTWNPNNEHNPSLSGATTSASGTYTVSVTDGNSCSATDDIVVTVNSLPAVTANADNNPVCEGSSITLTGGGADSYSWSGGVTNGTSFIPTVGTTTYTVTGTDANCSNTADIDVVVNDAPEVASGGNDAICADETYTLSGSYGGGATSVLWTTSGAGSFNDDTSPTATYTPAGADIPAVGASANTVILTITTNDPIGPCDAISDNMTLTINSMENASFSYSNGSYCNTAPDPTPTISGATGGTFSASAGITINPSTGLLDVSSGTVGQTYTIIYTTSGTCSNSSSVTVTINSGADAQFSYSTPICSSSSNPLPSHTTGSNGAYSSTTGLVFANTSTGEIDLSASTPGTYTITNYVDLGACGNDTKTFDITIDEAAEVFAGIDNTVCESDGSYSLADATEGGSTGTITWSGGTGSFSNINNINTNYVFGAGETGNVTLTVTTDNPAGVCSVVSDQIIITINDAAEVSAGADHSICEDQSYTLSGTSGGSTANISWSTSGDGTFDDNTSLTAIYTPGTTDAGAITLTISSDDPSGPCGIVSDDMILTINPLPSVIAGSNSPVCQGTTLNLTESGGNATAWIWTGGYNPADLQNPSQSSVPVSSTATYTVTGTITATGCSAQDIVSVTVNPSPVVTAGSNSPICENDQLDLTTGGDSDSWTWTSTTTYNPDDIQNPIHTNSLPTESGNYTVVGEISSTGCTASDMVTVTINALPTVTANADDNTVCEGTAVTLTGAGATTYTWLPAVTDGNPFIPSVGTTNYVVTGTDGNNCTNTDNIDIIVSPMPTVDAGINDAICEDQTYTLSGSIGGGASSATWTTSGDGSFNDINNLGATYSPGVTDPGTTVTLTLTTDDPSSDCGSANATMNLTINLMDDASFSYGTGTYCITAVDPTPTINGLTGGSFSSSPAGLVIDGSSGLIDVSTSTIGGPYTVTYTTNGICQNTSTFDITITAGADAEFAYVTPICNSDINPQPTHTTGSNGVYSSTAGLVFVNTSTGVIDLAASTPGTYTITNLVDLGTCGSDTKTFDITIDPAAEVFAGADDIVCESDLTYTLSNATQGGSTSSITWTTSGDGTFADNTLLNTSYTFGAADIGNTITLTVTTGDPGTSCGIVSDDIDISVDRAPIVDAGNDDAICAGETYQLSGNIGGSTSNITWSTSGNGTFDDENLLTATYTPGATDLTNGTVTLTITSNANGTCIAASEDMVLIINPLPNISAGGNSPICVGSQLDLTETGGEADTWVWTGTGSYDPDDIQNPSLNSVYMAAAGTYTVTGTIAATGCFASDNVDIIVNPVPDVIAGVITNPICANESIGLTETGGEANIWSWSATNGYSSTDNSPTIFNATADTSGMYYITGTIGATGCSSTDSVDITVNRLPIIAYNIEDNDTLCFGESVTLTGIANIDGTLDTATVYTWNNGVNDGIAFVPASTTTYTVLGEDINGCKDSVEVDIVINPLPIVFAGIDQIVPYNGTTTINDASPTGLDYSWTPSDSLIDGSVLHPTTIQLHVYNQFILEGTDPITGCSNKDTMNITIIGGPLSIQLFASPNDTICSGESHYVYVIPSGGTGLSENFIYSWSDGNGGVYPNNDTIFLDTVITSTTYYVTVSDEGVGIVNDSISIIINELPIISSIDSSNVLCYGDNSGSIIINATGDNPLGYSINSGVSFINDSAFTNLSQGTYDVVVQSSYGCVYNGGIVNISQPTEALSVTDTLIIDASCGNSNGLVAVEALGGTSPYSYLWDNSDTTNIVDTIYAGDYTITVEDYNGCQTTETYTVDNAGGGHLVLDNVIDVSCFGDSSGTITVNMVDGYPAFDFYILLNGVGIDSTINSNDSTFVINNIPANTYQVSAHEGAGCISTIDVTINQADDLIITDSIIKVDCYNNNNGAIYISTIGGTPGYTYNWYSGMTDSTLTDLSAGFYSVTVTDNNICHKMLDSLEITQPTAIDLTITSITDASCYNDSTGAILITADGGTVDYSYLWSNGDTIADLTDIPSGYYTLTLTDANKCTDTISAEVLNPTQLLLADSVKEVEYAGFISLYPAGGTEPYSYTWSNDITTSTNEYLSSGDYYVTVTDANGCTVYNSYSIEIPLIVPTVITPNSDGKNDFFNITNIETVENVKINIFNRWGDLVFTFNDEGVKYKEQGSQWDGTDINGNELPIGSYVYIIELDGNIDTYKGTVTIIR